jgi:hypothetical protein
MKRQPVYPSPSDTLLLGRMLRRHHDEQGFDWEKDYRNAVAEMDEPDESYTLEQHIQEICLLDLDTVAKHAPTENWTVDDWFFSLVADYYGSEYLEGLDPAKYKD